MNKNLLFLVLITSAFTSNAQSLLDKSLVWDGNNRDYVVYIPESYDGSLDVPLVFNFHGGGDYVDSWINAVDMRPIADAAHFILVYPQAFPDPTDGGSTNWIRKQPTTFDDVPFVDAMINSLTSEYNINQERIYACGYSLGGEFTYELACKLNNRIAAIGVVARTKFIETFNNCAPVHSTGVISILGTDDFISDYNGITFGGIKYYLSAEETNDYWVDYNNCEADPEITIIPNTNTSDGSTVERSSWATSDGCSYVEHLKVNGGGHDWPGDFGNMDINASQEIWNFVSRYDLNGLIDCATTSINENTESQVRYKVYPNPFEDQLKIESEITTAKEYKIYSIFGELIQSGALNGAQNSIHTSAIQPNIYVLRVGNETFRLLKTE